MHVPPVRLYPSELLIPSIISLDLGLPIYNLLIRGSIKKYEDSRMYFFCFIHRVPFGKECAVTRTEFLCKGLIK